VQVAKIYMKEKRQGCAKKALMVMAGVNVVDFQGSAEGERCDGVIGR
jgi:hypothetical protein